MKCKIGTYYRTMERFVTKPEECGCEKCRKEIEKKKKMTEEELEDYMFHNFN